MKIFAAALAFSLSAFAAHADPTPEEEKFLAVEGSERSYGGRDETKFERDALPDEVRALLGKQHWKSDGSIPDAFYGYAIDLNKDGSPEYFIKTIWGGSGGSAFIAIGQVEGTWKTLLDFQGLFHVIGQKGQAWPRLVSTSRGGGNNFCKRHFELEGDLYVEVLRENYRRGTITMTVRPENR
jgi:hypothetical protein